MLRRAKLFLFVGLSLIAAGPVARAEEPAKGESTKFLRITEDEDGEVRAMETAIVRYRGKNADGERVTVDLVAAIHIAERSYYEKLNRRFDRYDVVLYELVAPEGTRVPEGGGDNSSVAGMLQRGMQGLLGLQHQLSHVDYQKDNFVHADMSPEQFAESMRAKGENLWVLLFRMMGHSIAQQAKRGNDGGSSDMDLIRALFDRNRSLALKRVMAEQFQDLEAMTMIFEGPDGSTIITERNKVALKVLDEQIDEGNRRLAVFYGAGHMPDMEERLIERGFHRTRRQRWLTAWDLRDPRQRRREIRERNRRDEEPAAASSETEPSEE